MPKRNTSLTAIYMSIQDLVELRGIKYEAARRYKQKIIQHLNIPCKIVTVFTYAKYEGIPFEELHQELIQMRKCRIDSNK